MMKNKLKFLYFLKNIKMPLFTEDIIETFSSYLSASDKISARKTCVDWAQRVPQPVLKELTFECEELERKNYLGPFDTFKHLGCKNDIGVFDTYIIVDCGSYVLIFDIFTGEFVKKEIIYDGFKIGDKTITVQKAVADCKCNIDTPSLSQKHKYHFYCCDKMIWMYSCDPMPKVVGGLSYEYTESYSDGFIYRGWIKYTQPPKIMYVSRSFPEQFHYKISHRFRRIDAFIWLDEKHVLITHGNIISVIVVEKVPFRPITDYRMGGSQN